MRLFKTFKIGFKIGCRYLVRSKTKLALKSIEILNDNICTEIISVLKYNHISDDTLNSYFYIVLYEFIYLSIILGIKEKNEHKEIIQSSLQNIGIYYLMKFIIINPFMNTYNDYLN